MKCKYKTTTSGWANTGCVSKWWFIPVKLQTNWPVLFSFDALPQETQVNAPTDMNITTTCQSQNQEQVESDATVAPAVLGLNNPLLTTAQNLYPPGP